MIALLAVLLPVAELYVIVLVATRIGVLNTIGLLIAVSLAGGWLVKREGLGVLRRLQRTLDVQETPHKELLDGFLLLLAGVLLTVPGFLTDIPGLLLLLPPVRVVARSLLMRSFRRNGSLAIRVVGGAGRRSNAVGEGVLDVESHETERRSPPELM